jgi:hypothetical protein
MLEGDLVNGGELVVSEPSPAPATRRAELGVQPTMSPQHGGGAVVAELLTARAEAAAATAEVERLRERVHVLESWLEAAAQRRKVEYVQAQRLAMMKAVERDQRFTFVLSLPLVLLVLYCAALIGLVWLLAEGRI